MREVETSHCTVLVADDSADAREMVSLGLRMSGYRVLLANDGVEALEILSRDQCHVVVSDLTMPNMSGLELLRTMRSQPALEQIPFILMSAAHDELAQVAAETDGILQKPFDLTKLLRLLSRIHRSTPWLVPEVVSSQ